MYTVVCLRDTWRRASHWNYRYIFRFKAVWCRCVIRHIEADAWLLPLRIHSCSTRWDCGVWIWVTTSRGWADHHIYNTSSIRQIADSTRTLAAGPTIQTCCREMSMMEACFTETFLMPFLMTKRKTQRFWWRHLWQFKLKTSFDFLQQNIRGLDDAGLKAAEVYRRVRCYLY